jgi:MSHA biogenesis protein MshK
MAVICLMSSVCCCAEELVDPTRPPAGIAAPVAEAGAVVAATGLQSVIIGKNRRAAIIDGQTVELGGRIGEAKLIEVNPAGVVLRTAQGRQALMLFPDVKIMRVKTEAATVQTRKRVTSGERK